MSRPDDRDRVQPWWKRMLLVLLDTRGRWWLSLWLWVPACVALFWVSAHISQPASGWGGGGRWVFYQYGDEFVAAHTPKAEERDRDAFVAYWDVAVNVLVVERFDRVGVWLDLIATDRATGAAAPDPPVALREAVVELGELRDPSWHLESETDRAWAREKIVELVRSGSADSSRRRGSYEIRASRSRGVWRVAAAGVAEVGTPLAPTLLLVVCVLWFVRESQIAACRRVLRALDEGRCPRCSYDVSGTPGAPCPECGCDLEARAREAQGVIEGTSG